MLIYTDDDFRRSGETPILISKFDNFVDVGQARMRAGYQFGTYDTISIKLSLIESMAVNYIELVRYCETFSDIVEASTGELVGPIGW